MINLLPYDTKKQTRAARMNVIILRYIFILLISAAFLILACAVVYYYLNTNKTFSTEKFNINASTSNTQTQAGSSSTDIATAKNILDRQVSYGDIITGIAAILPTGTVLDSLSLNDTSFGTSTNLKILSRSAENETKLKDSFKTSTLFSNYKLESTSPNQDSSSGYPYTINISITINKGTS